MRFVGLNVRASDAAKLGARRWSPTRASASRRSTAALRDADWTRAAGLGGARAGAQAPLGAGAARRPGAAGRRAADPGRGPARPERGVRPARPARGRLRHAARRRPQAVGSRARREDVHGGRLLVHGPRDPGGARRPDGRRDGRRGLRRHRRRHLPDGPHRARDRGSGRAQDHRGRSWTTTATSRSMGSSAAARAGASASSSARRVAGGLDRRVPSRSTTPPTRAASAARRSRRETLDELRDALDAARAEPRPSSIVVRGRAAAAAAGLGLLVGRRRRRGLEPRRDARAAPPSMRRGRARQRCHG